MSCTVSALREGISGFIRSPLCVLFTSSQQYPDCHVMFSESTAEVFWICQVYLPKHD